MLEHQHQLHHHLLLNITMEKQLDMIRSLRIQNVHGYHILVDQVREDMSVERHHQDHAMSHHAHNQFASFLTLHFFFFYLFFFSSTISIQKLIVIYNGKQKERKRVIIQIQLRLQFVVGW